MKNLILKVKFYFLRLKNVETMHYISGTEKDAQSTSWIYFTVFFAFLTLEVILWEVTH